MAFMNQTNIQQAWDSGQQKWSLRITSSEGLDERQRETFAQDLGKWLFDKYPNFTISGTGGGQAA